MRVSGFRKLGVSKPIRDEGRLAMSSGMMSDIGRECIEPGDIGREGDRGGRGMTDGGRLGSSTSVRGQWLSARLGVVLLRASAHGSIGEGLDKVPTYSCDWRSSADGVLS